MTWSLLYHRSKCHYYVTKPAGKWYLLLINIGGCYLIDANFNLRRLQLGFRSFWNPDCRKLHSTLLDGEIVTRGGQLTYEIHDLLALDGVLVLARPFYERRYMIWREVLRPKLSNHKFYDWEKEPLKAVLKDYWLLPALVKALKLQNGVDNVVFGSHERRMNLDGAERVILQAWDASYTSHEMYISADKNFLFWKIPKVDSINFLFKVEAGFHRLSIHEDEKPKLMAYDTIEFDTSFNPPQYSGKIIKCNWRGRRREGNVWKFVRTKEDENPSDMQCYKKVMRQVDICVQESQDFLDVLERKMRREIEPQNYAEYLHVKYGGI